MPRLFIVSNRIPVTLSRDADGHVQSKRSAGGLVTGLSDLHRQDGVFWVGCDGLFDGRTAGGEEDPATDAARATLAEQRFLPVKVDERTYEGYYARLANGAIWPLFHYFPGFMGFKQEDWADYVAVNRQFADTILAKAAPGDRVWVHDYQLMLVPRMLRDEAPDLSIAYFHHIPFPSSEMFRILPARAEILNGLLGADLVGFHTLDYARHFMTCVTRLIGADVDKDSVYYQRRPTKVGAFPLGVDVASTRRQASDPTAVPGIDELAKSLEGKQVFVGIDRLDYTKGLPERLHSFRRLLQTHPELVGKIAFLQVCVPSRQDAPYYAELRHEVERLVGQINGEFGKPGYAPLQYLYQPFSPEQVTAFYKIGDFMLVTPLRDGLNLVAKEFVAARTDDDGVLILSELAGAAAEMGEALIVNPFDINGVAEKMYEAITMPAAERRRRMVSLRKRITSYNNVEWARDFQRAWAESTEPALSGGGAAIEGVAALEVASILAKQPRVRLFLDYDGTLTPIRRTPEEARPTPALIAAIDRVANAPGIELTILTGRPRAFLDDYFRGLPVGFVAEHSAFFKARGQDDWTATFNQDEWLRIRAAVLPHLESFVRRIPDSFIEEKETSLVLHYRKSEPVFAHAQALELKESLSQILTNTPYAAFKAKRALEIKPAAANKGLAIEQLIAGDEDPSLFLTAGDDLGDEAMYRVAPERNLSVHVGFGTSFARYRVDGPAAFWEILNLLTAGEDKNETPPQTMRLRETKKPWVNAMS